VQRSLAALADCGAMILESEGVSDISLHRCLLAGRAYRELRKEACAEKIEFVLWHDDDTVMSPNHVAALRASVLSTGACVSASYCKRNDMSTIAAMLYQHEPTSAPSRDMLLWAESGEVKVQFKPCLAGLGALMLSRVVFDTLVEHVPKIGLENGLFVPCICVSGPIKLAPTSECEEPNPWHWESEDFNLCRNIWEMGSAVLLAPIAVGHLSEVALLPVENAKLL
jgi:hypothetical protein